MIKRLLTFVVLPSRLGCTAMVSVDSEENGHAPLRKTE
jgi:hypothetical protein|tara:strand:- start:346 stop:459 length:114 start_codon:yes stop_codon:yes gene_type:complete